MEEEFKYAELTDEEQMALIQQTDNSPDLRKKGINIPQPPQDPNWVPEDAQEWI